MSFPIPKYRGTIIDDDTKFVIGLTTHADETCEISAWVEQPLYKAMFDLYLTKPEVKETLKTIWILKPFGTMKKEKFTDLQITYTVYTR